MLKTSTVLRMVLPNSAMDQSSQVLLQEFLENVYSLPETVKGLDSQASLFLDSLELTKFTVTFDYEMFDSEGANDPADGFSFNYGNAELGELGSAEEGMSGKATENLSFEVDTWRNGDPEQGVNISGVINGEDAVNLLSPTALSLKTVQERPDQWNPFDPSKGATFTQLDLH